MHRNKLSKIILPKFLLQGGYIALAVIAVVSFVASYFYKANDTSAQTANANLKVAFIGDDGYGENHKANLRMIKAEKAAFIVDGGDLEYKNNPTLWDNQFTSVMGANYPYFVAEGNHDIAQWPGYRQKLVARYGRVSGESCTGAIGQMQACRYKGVLLLLMAPGIKGAPSIAKQTDFIEKQLAASKEKWKICTWHYPLYQTNSGPAGDAIYEACRKGGAIIQTAHTHVYYRSKTLTNIPKRTIDPNCSLPKLVCVGLGKTFVFLSGLGGVGTQPAAKCNPCNEWAVRYGALEKSRFGALFIIFNYKGDSNTAHAYFKNIDGKIIDEFTITLEESAALTVKPTSVPTIMPTREPTEDSITPTLVPVVNMPKHLTPTQEPAFNRPIFNCLGAACITPLPSVVYSAPTSKPISNFPDRPVTQPTQVSNEGLFQLLIRLLQQLLRL